MIPFVDLKAQYRQIEAEINEAICDVITNCNFILGKQVNDFEKAFSKFVGTKHAIGVSSGLDALRISLIAMDFSLLALSRLRVWGIPLSLMKSL